jgi:hypothetical protein
MRYLYLLFLFSCCHSLSSQQYFIIKKQGINKTKKIWLNTLPYTIITSATQHRSGEILSYTDSSLQIFSYRRDAASGYLDTVSISLKDVLFIKKWVVANKQIYGTAAAVLLLGLVATVIEGVTGNTEGAAFLFGVTVAVPGAVMLVGAQVREFDMQKEWEFTKGTHKRRRNKNENK